MCNECLEVEDISDINEESPSMPTTNDFGLYRLGGP
jgi:hypothetical protein